MSDIRRCFARNQAVTGAPWAVAHTKEFPQLPYPGARPHGSWMLNALGALHALAPDADGWRNLATGELILMEERDWLVLAYGSNANPQKLIERFPEQEIVALEAEVHGWGSVWCNARRRTGQVVATLVEAPDRTESHVVLAVTSAQLKQMDLWEGHPHRYRRETFAGRVELAGGSVCVPQVYLGTEAQRPVLRVGGEHQFVSEHPYEEVDALVQ